LALISASKALALVDDVIARFGTANAVEFLNVDVDHLRQAFLHQLNSIVASMFDAAPSLVPDHPYVDVAEWADDATNKDDVQSTTGRGDDNYGSVTSSTEEATHPAMSGTEEQTGGDQAASVADGASRQLRPKSARQERWRTRSKRRAKSRRRRVAEIEYS
jgi:hypothetical protein